MTWEYDRETKWHTNQVPDFDAFVFVYKTPAGDYAISAMYEGDACGGDVDYMTTLAQAKRKGELLIESHRWTDYVLQADDAE